METKKTRFDKTHRKDNLQEIKQDDKCWIRLEFGIVLTSHQQLIDYVGTKQCKKLKNYGQIIHLATFYINKVYILNWNVH